MKVTGLYVYPIKSLRGISLTEAVLQKEGLKHDRKFLLCHVQPDGSLKKVQVNKYPQCSRFVQTIVNDSIHVRYEAPDEPLLPPSPLHTQVLEVPLQPAISTLEKCDVNLHQSLVKAYRMASHYDAWFSACLGFHAALFYIGDGRRPVLGTFAPRSQNPAPTGGLLSTLASYVQGTQKAPEPYWLAFSDCAPYLITTEASLRHVSGRLNGATAQMHKFRPNVVVDGEDEWEEDFWGELAVNGRPMLEMTKLCARCVSINVDYDTGRMGAGEDGKLLKLLSSDRRVDPGCKYSPVFGRYGFLVEGVQEASMAIGDEVAVTKRVEERPANDWPIKDVTKARFYYQS
ncbi:hypothetical protein S40285_02801 [Stachybotrys chlorohalonatus IBT 40285]|uniref:MOSC domain-containing protein n=1 Tax=Stachybotrys chlorohalonatus (strain IBT 40285) TaxID=1283841 RepID=A0A084QDA8_STAC4|nr:hypothetical protein S40285_02801 [Stachybotrys chlorohalonata IBT 40285]